MAGVERAYRLKLLGARNRRGEVSVKRFVIRSLCASTIALFSFLVTAAASFGADRFPIPTSCPPATLGGTCQPAGITAGPDGNLWFTEEAGNKIGRITTGGAITEFPIPSPSSLPVEITPGPDGRSGSPNRAPTTSRGSRPPASSPIDSQSARRRTGSPWAQTETSGLPSRSRTGSAK